MPSADYEPSLSANLAVYNPWVFTQVTPTGIEPVLPPWKGDVLTAWPRSHILFINVDKKTPRVGLEPTTSRLTAVRSTIELSRIILWYNKLKKYVFSYSLFLYTYAFAFSTFKTTHCVSFNSPTRSSLRPISICQLHTLLYFHLRPIYLVVFKGSYWLIVRDILSWGGLHA